MNKKLTSIVIEHQDVFSLNGVLELGFRDKTCSSPNKNLGLEKFMLCAHRHRKLPEARCLKKNALEHVMLYSKTLWVSGCVTRLANKLRFVRCILDPSELSSWNFF